MTEYETIKAVVEKNGTEQLIIAIEELSELTKALTKHIRYGGGLNDIAEEMADVTVIIDELKIYFENAASVNAWRSKKIERTKEREL